MIVLCEYFDGFLIDFVVVILNHFFELHLFVYYLVGNICIVSFALIGEVCYWSEDSYELVLEMFDYLFEFLGYFLFVGLCLFKYLGSSIS